MLFVEYPKCSTCQKAKKWLDAMLVKRPIVVREELVMVGFKVDEWEKNLGHAE